MAKKEKEKEKEKKEAADEGFYLVFQIEVFYVFLLFFIVFCN
jgi:hypothetical protein